MINIFTFHLDSDSESISVSDLVSVSRALRKSSFAYDDRWYKRVGQTVLVSFLYMLNEESQWAFIIFVSGGSSENDVPKRAPDS